MTNKEKATCIAYANRRVDRRGYSSFNECKQSALEMAKWKDHQFKEYLENRRNRIAEINTKDYAGWEMHYMADITEIINELF